MSQACQLVRDTLVAMLKLWKVRIGLLVVVFAIFVAISGFRNHWRWSSQQALKDCRTGETIDDGTNIIGTALDCGYRCAPGTETEATLLHEMPRC